MAEGVRNPIVGMVLTLENALLLAPGQIVTLKIPNEIFRGVSSVGSGIDALRKAKDQSVTMRPAFALSGFWYQSFLRRASLS